ncbi:MAG: polyprenyl synthetase family protein [Bacilli bacterium]
MKNNFFIEKIMGKGDLSFSSEFDKCWYKTLDDICLVHKNASQLRVGNRLRPKLTAWGYSFNQNPHKGIDFSNITDIAVSIELIHKASIIIDDYIDNDTKRNGLPSFHCEFSSNEAILFGMYLLGLAARKIIDNTNYISKDDFSTLKNNIHLFSDIICQMTMGGIKEITMDNIDFSNIDLVKDIISLETVSIIKNSILMGYFKSKDNNKKNEYLLKQIGDKCGYVFQILNDLEPFSKNNRNITHKGRVNIDITQSRKNIIFSYIYNMSSYDDKNKIIYTSLSSDLQRYLDNLYIKYNVRDIVLADLEIIKQDIFNNINLLSPYSKEWKCDFQQFVKEMIVYCIDRTGG